VNSVLAGLIPAPLSIPRQARRNSPLALYDDFEFESGQQPSGNSLEWSCDWADSSRFESARWLKTNSMVRRTGEIPQMVRSSKTSAKAQPEDGFARIASARFSRCQTAVFCSGLSV